MGVLMMLSPLISMMMLDTTLSLSIDCELEGNTLCGRTSGTVFCGGRIRLKRNDGPQRVARRP
jgi:hypothetical protein